MFRTDMPIQLVEQLPFMALLNYVVIEGALALLSGFSIRPIVASSHRPDVQATDGSHKQLRREVVVGPLRFPVQKRG